MWKDLSLKEKAELIKLYVSNGITNRRDIIADYNSSIANEGNLYGAGSWLRSSMAKSYDTPTFDEAFRQARIDGRNYFKWNGNRYSTEMKPTVYEKTSSFGFYTTKAQREAMRDTWDYMRSHNVSARNAAAIMGNMMQESSFNPSAVQAGGDSAVGYFQMHGKRLKDYRNYLGKNKLKDSPHTQIDYMLDVMRGKRGDFYMDEYNRSKQQVDSLSAIRNRTRGQEAELRKFKQYHEATYGTREREGRLYPIADFATAFEDNTTSLNDLTALFTDTIERAGKPEYEKRQDYANKIYNHFYGVPKVVEQ